MNLKAIRRDLGVLQDYDVVLFGSYVRDEARPGSDIDVAVITHSRDQDQNYTILQGFLGIAPQLYDIKVYELLPLKIQVAIADEFVPVFGDALDLSEYFYSYRKLWDDCKARVFANMFHSYKEKLQALQRI